jgi:phospholipase A1/A2
MAFRLAVLWYLLHALLRALPASGATFDADAALQRCAAIEDALERLACYDTLAGRLPPRELTPQSDQPSQATPQPLAAAIQEGTAGARLTFLSRHWELDPAAKQGTFLLRPHKQNYFLPARYSNAPNDQPTSPTQGPPPPTDLDNVEAKFQVSLKTKVAERMFDGHADLWLAYTQQSSWQVYNGALSRPFRETDYEPEVFMVFPIDSDVPGLRARFVNVGLVHQSNGRSDPLSRSWNRIYGQLGFERGNFVLMARAWYRIPESYSDDNNPDIEHFLGYGDLLAVYKWNARNTVSLLVRNNLNWGDNKGALQLDWSFPLYGRLKGYVQLFSGYGESMIDYNWRQTTFGVGVLLTDWM